MKTGIFFVLAMVCFAVNASAAQRTQEMTTYYPAPYGEYNELLLAPQSAPTCDATRKGAMYYDEATLKLYICNGATWKSVGGGGGEAPTGAIMAFDLSTPPDGWLECGGASVSSVTYPDLFAAIGTKHGSSTNMAGEVFFNLPDYRGLFLRGWNHNRNTGLYDPDVGARTGGDTVGSTQADELKSHRHRARMGVNGSDQFDYISANNSNANTNEDHWTVVAEGGNESRPKNIYVMYCIKT